MYHLPVSYALAELMIVELLVWEELPKVLLGEASVKKKQ